MLRSERRFENTTKSSLEKQRCSKSKFVVKMNLPPDFFPGSAGGGEEKREEKKRESVEKVS